MFVNAASFPVVALAGLALEARRRAERAELGKPDVTLGSLVVARRLPARAKLVAGRSRPKRAESPAQSLGSPARRTARGC